MYSSNLIIRRASEADLDEVASMVEGFVEGHPAQSHPRPRAQLREAYFGAQPVAHLLVAARAGRLVGMAQWRLEYDIFWGFFGGEMGWLYVRPEARGSGIAAALAAAVCSEIRAAGGQFLHGGADVDENAALYQRVAVSMPGHTCYVSAEAFQSLADLAGASPREIVRRLPDPKLNRVPARAR